MVKQHKAIAISDTIATRLNWLNQYTAQITFMKARYGNARPKKAMSQNDCGEMCFALTDISSESARKQLIHNTILLNKESSRAWRTFTICRSSFADMFLK